LRAHRRDRLADIGGGTGNYPLALENEGWGPVVIDRSPEMLAFAAQKRLAIIAAAAEQLPVADESFDGCGYCAAISEWHRLEVLTPDSTPN
jgi:ubiquinone/menaquinone biosynthesis C-methylase UbiE